MVAAALAPLVVEGTPLSGDARHRVMLQALVNRCRVVATALGSDAMHHHGGLGTGEGGLRGLVLGQSAGHGGNSRDGGTGPASWHSGVARLSSLEVAHPGHLAAGAELAA